MSFPSHLPGGAPTYVRQNSYETQSSARGGSPNPQYPYASHPPLPQARFVGPSNPVPQQGPVQRRQTVRGAVRGTIREAGTNNRLAAAPSRALTRGKTLTRPDRFVAPAPLINPPGATGGAIQTTLVNGVPTLTTKESNWDPWSIFVNVVTFYAPRRLLTSVGLTDRAKQRAWKEKVALCTIALFLMGVVGFVTIGLTRVLCPSDGPRSTSAFTRLGSQPGTLGCVLDSWTNANFHTGCLQASSGSKDGTFESPRVVVPPPSSRSPTISPAPTSPTTLTEVPSPFPSALVSPLATPPPTSAAPARPLRLAPSTLLRPPSSPPSASSTRPNLSATPGSSSTRSPTL